MIVAGTEYKAESNNTKFVVNDLNDITLVDNGSTSANSSLSVSGTGTTKVDGNSITTSKTGTDNKGYIITKTADGNKLNVMNGANVSATLGNSTDLEIVGNDSVTINNTVYTAPQNGMTLSGNQGGQPTIEIHKANESVKVGDKNYTAGTNNSKLIVNSPNNVTLVDNGSSLVVSSPSTMTIDGNNITATGSTGGGYTITKTEDGNSLKIKDGTKIEVTMGTGGSDLIVNETLQYNGQCANGNGTLIKSNSDGSTIVIDKSVANEFDEYVANIGALGNTTLKPVFDENGNIIGFETSIPEPEPIPTPPSSSSSEEVEEELEEEVPNASNETDTDEENELEDEEVEEETEETEDDPETENIESDLNKEYSEDREEQSVVLETLEEAEDIQITGNTTVSYGTGEIIIKAEGKGDITSQLGTILEACFTEKELDRVQKGENVEVRFVVKLMKEEISQEEKEQIQSAYQQFAEKITGLHVADSYNIVIERKIGDSEWEPVHELNKDLDIVVDIPKELRKENRTYYLMRNHEGVCTLLTDKDEALYTITVSTSQFSTYVIVYTDTEVVDVDIDELNQIVANTDSGIGCTILWIMLVLIILVSGYCGWRYYRKKKENSKLNI